MSDALVTMRRAIAIDPMSVVAWRGLILLLMILESAARRTGRARSAARD